MRLLCRNILQLAGIGAVLTGIWLVFPPAAIVLGGAALVLWAEGQETEDDRDDR